MIRAIVFDLDGTLVQTERLKAISYARAAVELCPKSITEDEVVEAYKSVVGRSRQEVAQALVERFGLEEVARRRMTEFAVSAPWQAFVRIRLQIYDKMLADPDLIQSKQWPHNVALLHAARRGACKTALATMSHCDQVTWILKVLNLTEAFDFVAARDDVERGKPDPEIYRLVARELGVSPDQCLVIEDSPSGVQAALSAGMACIAVTTPFTRDAVHAAKLLDPQWIVDEPDRLPAVVQGMLAECIDQRSKG